MAEGEKKKTLFSVTPAINVTPLIDVLLVLLIIFMVISPYKPAQLPVQAPAPGGDGPPRPETLMLNVSKDFGLELNTKPLSLNDLGVTLSKVMKERTPEFRVLFIKAPREAPYEVVMMLIDQAKGAGALKIGLLPGE